MNNNYYKKRLLQSMLSVILIIAINSLGEEGKNDPDTTASSEDAVKKEQTLCPLADNKIDKESFADYEGKRVYLCCDGCLARFKNNPQKAIEKLEERGVTVAMSAEVTTQKSCPINGNSIDKTLFADHDFKRLFFCSEKCRKKFKKNPQKYVKN